MATQKRPAASPGRTRKKPTTAATATSHLAPDLQEEISRRAYELYEERGREDGHAAEDWLRAEAEVRERHRQRSA